MRSASAALAALLLLAVAATAFAVNCGDLLGDVQYLSGCTACTAVNVTFGGRNETRHNETKPEHQGGKGSKGRNLLHWGGEGGMRGNTTKLLPNCTECDASKNFELKTKPANSSHADHPYMGRCGCKSGHGANPTGNVTVTWGNKTKTIPTFECVKCGDAQVTLSRGSGVMPVYDKVTKTWSLVLISSITPAKASKYGLPYPVTPETLKAGWGGQRKAGHDGDKGKGRGEGHGEGKGPGGKGPGFGPYFPGQCIDCPAGSTKSGSACVKA